MTLSSTQFETIRSGLVKRSAILLEQDKEYLVEARLNPIVRQHGLSGLAELINILSKDENHLFWQDVVDAMTTNETYFFRDDAPFIALKNHILPTLITQNRNRKELSIWSAASSTGQEAYSLAILLYDNFPEVRPWKVEIVGTDISPTVLERANSGLYSALEVSRGLTEEQQDRHFRHRTDGKREVREHLRNHVRFLQLNLVDSYGLLPRFDLVLIRNVLIYFALDTKKKILEKVHQQMNPGAFLMLGGSETTLNITDVLERDVYEGATYYRRK